MADIKVRVGQQNAVKVIASNAAASNTTNTSINVIGGIASVTSLSVSGISTIIGISTFQNNVFVDGTLVAGLIDGGSF